MDGPLSSALERASYAMTLVPPSWLVELAAKRYAQVWDRPWRRVDPVRDPSGRYPSHVCIACTCERRPTVTLVHNVIASPGGQVSMWVGRCADCGAMSWGRMAE